LRSDIMRKQLAGVGETDRLPEEAYSVAASHAVYEELYRTAARILETGHSVIADAVFARQGERDAIAEVGRTAGAPFTGLWLDAPLHVLTARVGARTGDASDADEEVVRRQAGYDLGDMTWTRVDASGVPDEALEQARRILHQDRIRET